MRKDYLTFLIVFNFQVGPYSTNPDSAGKLFLIRIPITPISGIGYAFKWEIFNKTLMHEQK